MVVFRVDANSMIGKGHMKRCVAIAKAINCLKDIISEKNAKVCVVDSYDVSNTAFNSLKEVCKVILIEDYLYEVYDVDAIINYNLYADKIDYMTKYKGSTKLLLGIEYAPYGNEFLGSFRVIDKHDIDSIMVYTGELDPHELAPGIVDSLLDCIDDSVRLRVVTSKNATTRDILFKMSNTSSQIIVEPDIASYSKLLKGCDIAVTIADSVCYDILSSNVPAVVFQSDYSQNMLLKSLTNSGLMAYGGDFVNKSNKFYGDLVAGVNKLTSEEERMKIRANIAGLKLGQGANNLAKAILEYEKN